MNTAPKLPSADQLRLQMGELTPEEVLIAQAAYRLGAYEAALAPPSGEGVDALDGAPIDEVARGIENWETIVTDETSRLLLNRAAKGLRRLTTPQSAPVDGEYRRIMGESAGVRNCAVGNIRDLAESLRENDPSVGVFRDDDQRVLLNWIADALENTDLYELTTTPPPASQERGVDHSVEDDYRHFLAYANLDHSPWLRYAYHHGADCGIDRPDGNPSDWTYYYISSEAKPPSSAADYKLPPVPQPEPVRTESGSTVIPNAAEQAKPVGAGDCATVTAAVLLADKSVWRDDEGVRWVPETAYQAMISEIERLETLLYPDYAKAARLAGGVMVDDAMVRRALDGQDAYWNDDTLYVTCERCDGKGHHGGFGEGGHDQDWCETCGGPGSINIGTESGGMRAALVAALGAK